MQSLVQRQASALSQCYISRFRSLCSSSSYILPSVNPHVRAKLIMGLPAIGGPTRTILLRKVLAYRSTLSSLARLPFSSSTFAQTPRLRSQMGRSTYSCDIDAEPLHRYHRSGYHPVHLGDYLGNGRYKILHKLGWGGYSTVWAARDTRSRFL